jgi:hypothetical protein
MHRGFELVLTNAVREFGENFPIGHGRLVCQGKSAGGGSTVWALVAASRLVDRYHASLLIMIPALSRVQTATGQTLRDPCAQCVTPVTGPPSSRRGKRHPRGAADARKTYLAVLPRLFELVVLNPPFPATVTGECVLDRSPRRLGPLEADRHACATLFTNRKKGRSLLHGRPSVSHYGVGSRPLHPRGGSSQCQP